MNKKLQDYILSLDEGKQKCFALRLLQRELSAEFYYERVYFHDWAVEFLKDCDMGADHNAFITTLIDGFNKCCIELSKSKSFYIGGSFWTAFPNSAQEILNDTLSAIGCSAAPDPVGLSISITYPSLSGGTKTKKLTFNLTYVWHWRWNVLKNLGEDSDEVRQLMTMNLVDINSMYSDLSGAGFRYAYNEEKNSMSFTWSQSAADDSDTFNHLRGCHDGKLTVPIAGTNIFKADIAGTNQINDGTTLVYGRDTENMPSDTGIHFPAKSILLRTGNMHIFPIDTGRDVMFDDDAIETGSGSGGYGDKPQVYTDNKTITDFFTSKGIDFDAHPLSEIAGQY